MKHGTPEATAVWVTCLLQDERRGLKLTKNRHILPVLECAVRFVETRRLYNDNSTFDFASRASRPLLPEECFFLAGFAAAALPLPLLEFGKLACRVQLMEGRRKAGGGGAWVPKCFRP